MSTEGSPIPITADERRTALGWLRNALTTVLEVSPIPKRIKKPTQQQIGKVPDWFITKWAAASNVDFLNDYRLYPDVTSIIADDIGKAAVQQYIEAHGTMATVSALGALVKRVINLADSGRLPIEGEMVVRQTFALAMAGFIPSGQEFTKAASAIISHASYSHHLLIDYGIALEYREQQRLKALDAALNSSAYGAWVAERLTEAKRYLGLEPPRFIIRRGERTPQWDLLWQRIFTGGDET